MSIPPLPGIFASVPFDLLVIGFVVIIVTIDTMRSGTTHASALALSLPIAAFLFDLLPRTFVLGSLYTQAPAGLPHAVIFLAIFVPLFLLLNRILESYGPNTGIFQGVLCGIATAVVLAVVWSEVPALQALWHFGAQAQAIFAEAYRFWWLVAAYLTLGFARS